MHSLLQGPVEFDSNGTRLPHETRLFRYMESPSTSSCQGTGKYNYKKQVKLT